MSVNLKSPTLPLVILLKTTGLKMPYNGGY